MFSQDINLFDKVLKFLFVYTVDWNLLKHVW